jgi:dienelactone hydrolase
VKDVSYPSGGDRVRAYLVDPADGDVHGGVVVVHGSGGDRDELLPRARQLAERGIAALAITAPSAHAPAPPRTLAALLTAASASQLRDVAAARSGLDYLSRVPGVDGRLGYLGWSAGAKTGAFVAARDQRIRGAALLSAGAATVDEFAAQAPAAARRLVRQALAPIDPIAQIHRARPGTVLLEDGRSDEVVPRPALENMIHAAPPRTTVRWYDAGHALNDRAYDDAIAWLASRLQ